MTENPLIEVFVGGIGGIISGFIIDAFIPVFSALNIPLILWVVFAVVLIIDIIAGLTEAFAGGFLFALGMLAAGFIMADVATILTGFVGMFGFIFGAIAKSSR